MGFVLERASFKKGLDLQERKQEVTKVISLVKDKKSKKCI